MKHLFLFFFLLGTFCAQAQEDAKVKTGTFDYVAYGKTYEYTGEYVISKESGGKEKLPHGKGKLVQPEKLDKAITDGDMVSIEKYTKKGYSPEPYSYDGEWHMGKKQGAGKEQIYTFEETAANVIVREKWNYNGQYKDDVFDGKGTLNTLEFEYTGGFKAGKKDGDGTINYKNGNTYTGQWQTDQFHGKGVFINKATGEKFDGEYYLGNYHKGTFLYKSGDTYNGEWKNNQPHGEGTYTWKTSGDKHEGEFVDGKPEGRGKFTKKDGSVFLGVFKNGACTGTAKMSFTTNYKDINDDAWQKVMGIYEGDIKDNLPHGEGEFLSNKNVTTVRYEWDEEGMRNEVDYELPVLSYKGSWLTGKKHGQGETSFADDYGEVHFQGTFKEDLFDCEKCTLHTNRNEGVATQSNYTGGFKSGKYHGFGKEENTTDGMEITYEGQFNNGKYHGEGKYREDSGMDSFVKIGTFQNNEIIQGTYEFYANSDKQSIVYKGSFKDGREHGMGKIEYFGALDGMYSDWSENKVKSYEGEWANGLPNGQGTIVYKNGTKVTDIFINGVSFPPVTIGKQVWMSVNLNVDKFRNGDPISEAKTDEEWEKADRNKQPAWCYYNNDPANGAKYGKLYNWYAVNDPRGLAPKGWHIPSDAEWRILTDYLGSDAGTKMKSTSGWKDKGNGTNSSGFSGLPGGYRDGSGAFGYIGETGDWWSSTEGSTSSAWTRGLNYVFGNVVRNYFDKGGGLSVRCLRD